jgi:hypothetical protein
MAYTRKNRKNSRKAERKDRKSRKDRKQEGGKRKMSAWNKSVMRVYEEMKGKDPKTTFSAALKEAAKRKKAGNL